jgi:DNA polymerase-3 subunit chi
MRVDFYVLSDPTPAAAPGFACRLSERAWKSGHRVVILVTDESSAKRMDELLWTFRDDAFIPHVYATSDTRGNLDEPVVVCTDVATALSSLEHDRESPSLLINLCDAVPLSRERFDRIAEIVPADEQSKHNGRDRYRVYREGGGAELHSHEV